MTLDLYTVMNMQHHTLININSCKSQPYIKIHFDSIRRYPYSKELTLLGP